MQVFICETTTTGINIPIDPTHAIFVEKCREKIESIGLPPVERRDLLDVLSSKFVPERFSGIIEYGRLALSMSSRAIEELVKELAYRCLEIGCKGKMLKRLVELYPVLDEAIRLRIMQKYKLAVDDLPPWGDEEACLAYEAPLCRDLASPRVLFGDPMGPSTSENSTPASAPSQAQNQVTEVGTSSVSSEDKDTVMKNEDEEDDDDLVGVTGRGTRL